MAISLQPYGYRATAEMTESMGGKIFDLPSYYHEAMAMHLAQKRINERRWAKHSADRKRAALNGD